SHPSSAPARSTASSNGRCSNACSGLWWMKMLIGPCAGSRCASRSITRVRGWSEEPGSRALPPCIECSILLRVPPRGRVPGHDLHERFDGVDGGAVHLEELPHDERLVGVG